MTKDSFPVPDGALLVDKPEGSTSFEVVKQVKRWVRPKKVGHTGTLDPLATGLLPLLIGEATKLTRFLAEESKRYQATIQLGTATDTWDREGREVDHRAVPVLSESLVRECLGSMIGDISQLPPMFSALHHNGKRMYELAREGIEVERKPRTVRIESIDLVRLGTEEMEIDVLCGSGTYIRSLAVDIAERLGTVGHLKALRRTETSGWSVDLAVKLAETDKKSFGALVLPLETILERFLRVQVDGELSRQLGNGVNLGPDSLSSLISLSLQSVTTICFFLPEGGPVVLARVESHPDGKPARMKILRQIHLKH
jgi:tRNA pseudouridine55 synthase